MLINQSKLLNSLKEMSPDIYLKLISVLPNHESLDNFIKDNKIQSYDEFNMDLFQAYLNILNHISFNTNNNSPVKGELSLNNTSGELLIFDGSNWINISTK